MHPLGRGGEGEIFQEYDFKIFGLVRQRRQRRQRKQGGKAYFFVEKFPQILLSPLSTPISNLSILNRCSRLATSLSPHQPQPSNVKNIPLKGENSSQFCHPSFFIFSSSSRLILKLESGFPESNHAVVNQKESVREMEIPLV